MSGERVREVATTHTAAGTAVILDRISFAIGGTPVLQEVSGHIPAGAVTGLLGPNGAGKSTLLRLIAGIETPAAGSVFLADAGVGTRGGTGAGAGTATRTAIGSLPRREVARRIALLEQTAAPNVELSVLEVVLLGRIPHRSRLLGSFGGDDDRELALDALGAVGSADLAARGWHTLSGGQQQRVQIARALAQQPTILLLDEPTNHLDISAQLSLLAQVRTLGLTSVAALHDLNLAAAYCDHVLLLQDGRVVAAGPPEKVLRPEIIASVYGVDCDVIPHPRGGHPVIVYSPTVAS